MRTHSVFAIGSTKRVGAAIGDGAGVVAQPHAVLADTRAVRSR